MSKSENIEKVRQFFHETTVMSLRTIVDLMAIHKRTVQKHLREMNCFTSFTHKRKYLTLPETPKFDENGIWFFDDIGFSRFGDSLDTILALIKNRDEGYMREELEGILRISISKQIQTLLFREKLDRIKLGGRYLYLPGETIKNKKKMLKAVGSYQAEEHFEKGVRTEDMVGLIKAILLEKVINMDDIKSLIRRYQLKLPPQKIERLLLKYDLSKKKCHDAGQ